MIPRPENYTKSLIKTVGWVDETSGYIPHDLQFATMKVGLHFTASFLSCRPLYYIQQQDNISELCYIEALLPAFKSLQALNVIFGDFSMIKYYPVYHTKAQMSAKKTN